MKLNSNSLVGLKPEFPLVESGVYFAQIMSAEVVDSKKTEGGQNLKLEVMLLNDELPFRENGSVVTKHNKGVRITRYISLTPSEKYNPDTTLAEISRAITREGEAEKDDLELENLQGAYCKVKVAIRPATDKYNAANDLARFLPIKSEDNFIEPQNG